MATTRNDKLMYAVLILAIIAGLATTLIGSGLIGEEHNYRETVSVWFRSIFILQPDGEAMTMAPLSFQIHALIGMALFALWPFTRLVHAFSAPIGYLFRPYIVYRSRGAARPGAPIGSRTTPPGLVGMCSYCGCRNIPMIAKLNAEHDAIVNSTYALQVAFRDQDVESAGPPARTSATCCTRIPIASRSACSPKWKRTNCSPSTSPHSAPSMTNWTRNWTRSTRAT